MNAKNAKIRNQYSTSQGNLEYPIKSRIGPSKRYDPFAKSNEKIRTQEARKRNQLE